MDDTGLAHDARCESEYEELRAAVGGGGEFHAGKTHGLTILVACGTYAWIGSIKREGVQKLAAGIGVRPCGREGPAGHFATLLANLIEASHR